MKKIKVLRVITRLNIGGVARHTVYLTSLINKDKYDPLLFSGKIEEHEEDMSFFATQYNVKPKYLKQLSRELNPKSDLKTLWELYKIIKKEKPDIVHTHTAKAGTLGRLAAWLARVPIIIHTFHGNVFKGYFGPRKTKFFIKIEQFLAKKSTKIIAISKSQKQELIDFRITRPSKIEVINLGFEFDNIIPTIDDRGLFRKENNFPDEAILIGIVGRLAPIKNHMLYLDIAEQICIQHSNVYFPIVGDGELRAEIETEIKKRKLENRVKIVGFYQNLKKVYADLDLVILTSHNEGTPVALIEAMVCKKIVITTNVGGVKDFITNNETGFYIDSFDPKPFVEKINQWLDGKIDNERIGENANKKALKKFSAKRLVADIEALYQKLLSKKK